jgi:hypothetical protein
MASRLSGLITGLFLLYFMVPLLPLMAVPGALWVLLNLLLSKASMACLWGEEESHGLQLMLAAQRLLELAPLFLLLSTCFLGFLA